MISSIIDQKIYMLATGLINYLNKLLDHPNMAHHLATIARDIIRELLIPGEVTSQVFWILCTSRFHLSIADLQMTCIYLRIGNNDKPPKMATIATHPVLICFPQHAQLADATFHNLKSTSITHNFAVCVIIHHKARNASLLICWRKLQLCYTTNSPTLVKWSLNI